MRARKYTEADLPAMIPIWNEIVEEGNGVGLISRFTLSPIPHRLRICPVIPAIGTEIGLIACDLNDLTPVAGEFARMVREISKNLL